MTAETAPEPHSQTHWFLLGMRGLFSLPAIILMLSFVGFAAFTAEAKIPVGQVMFMTGIVWALHRTMGFRVEEDHETSGVDLVIHAETAYDLHVTAGARPHFGGGSSS